MHFRHVLIAGLLVGATLLLPDQGFAEKNNLNGQQKPGHTSEIVKNSPEKTVAVSERHSANKGKVKQQIAVKKQAAISTKLPSQANGNGPSLEKKTKKAKKKSETKQALIVKEKTKRLQNNKKRANKIADLEIKDKPVIAIKYEPQKESSHLTMAKQEKKSIPVPEKRKSPTSKEPIPAVNQGTSPTQRTGNSAGPSNDRVSIGQNTIGSIDKWFEWNKHYKIKHVQPFYSRYVLMSNQWVNAPPSPPPKEAPFLKA